MLKFTPLIFAFVSLPALAQPLTPAEVAKVDQMVVETLADTGVPSAQIAVVRDGKIVLDKAYGKASETLPATPALPYQIASVSKQFTAMLMLLLEDEGKLDLDDRVAKYFPDITDADKITIRQLLSHTSGLQDFWPQDYSFAAMAKATTPQGIVDRWAKKPLDYAPGDKWQYSNTGYVVAGMIAEKVTGKPLLQLMRDKMFKPLGMTSVLSQDDAIGARYPSGYGRYALGPVRPVTPPARGWLWSAAELSMTAADLAKWDIARMNRAVLPADDWAEQETTIKLNDGTDTHYGLGVYVRDVNGRKVVSHGGEAVGFLSNNAVYPDQKSAIAVLTNSWSAGAHGRISRDLATILLPPPAPDAQALAAAASARRVYDELRAGQLDRALLTDNANYYFTQQAVSDFHSSLAPLGEPISFEPSGRAVLRGGFVIQSYTIKYPGKTLNLSTFYEPGANGRIEQFLVSEAE